MDDAESGYVCGLNGKWHLGDHSRPLHTFDETCHVPLICRQPGKILPGRRADLMISNYDLWHGGEISALKGRNNLGSPNSL